MARRAHEPERVDPHSYDVLNEVLTTAEIVERELAFVALPAFLAETGDVVLLAASAAAAAGGGAGGDGSDVAADEGEKEDGERLAELLAEARRLLPDNAEDWLANVFTSHAESLPAAVVISDMSEPGAPMVYVNDEFCRITGYDKAEALGRNCRFLQGPATEVEAIQVIRATLSGQADCQVKLTNYRKNGAEFVNLLSMRPIFDRDGAYKFVVAIQFEISEDDDQGAKLRQLDSMLAQFPKSLPFRSEQGRPPAPQKPGGGAPDRPAPGRAALRLQLAKLRALSLPPRSPASRSRTTRR